MCYKQKIFVTKKKKIFINSLKKSQKGQGLLFYTKFGLLTYPIIHYFLLGSLIPNSYYKFFTKVPNKIFETIIKELKKKGFFNSRGIQIKKKLFLKDRDKLLKEIKDADEQTKIDEIKNNKLIPKLKENYNDIKGFIEEINKKKIFIVKQEIELEISKYHQKKGNKYNIGDNYNTIKEKIKILTLEIQNLESMLLIHQYFYQSLILDDIREVNIFNQEEKKKLNNNLNELLNQKYLNSYLSNEKINLSLVKEANRIPYHHLLSNIKKIFKKIDPNGIIYLLYFKLIKMPIFISKYNFLREIFGSNLKISEKDINQKIGEYFEEKIFFNNAKNLLAKLGINPTTK